MPLFAEFTTEGVIGLIASGVGVGGLGTALVAFYFRTRELARMAKAADAKTRRETVEADAKIERDADAAEMALDAAALMKVIDDLREDSLAQRKVQEALREATLQRILAANAEAHEAEKKMALAESRLAAERERREELAARVAFLEGRSK